MTKANKWNSYYITDNYNIGLALLRAYMCFGVVLLHFWKNQSRPSSIANLFFSQRIHAVPVFILTSFLLTKHFFMYLDMKRVRKRLYRILYPHIAWGGYYYIIYSIINLLIKEKNSLEISDLFCQIVTGHSPKLNVAMWFQINLFFLTLLFVAIIAVCKEYKIYVFYLLAVFSYFMQYSGLNVEIFGKFCFELKYPFGRFLEMLPLAITGYFVAFFEVLEKGIKHRMMTVLVAILTLIVIKTTDILVPIDGFNYQGIETNLISICFVTIFYLIPFTHIPDTIKRFLIILSQYTMGIYCMHFMVGRIMKIVCAKIGMPSETFTFCVLVWIICYLISYLLSLIPGNYMEQIVN